MEMRSSGEVGIYLISSSLSGLGLNVVFVFGRGEQAIGLSGILHLDDDQPSIAIWFFVDLLGRIVEGFVHLNNRSGDRHIDLTYGLDAFDRAEWFSGFEAVTGLGQLHVHDIAELLLSVVRYADRSEVPFCSDPLMVFGISKIFRRICHVHLLRS